VQHFYNCIADGLFFKYISNTDLRCFNDDVIATEETLFVDKLCVDKKSDVVIEREKLSSCER